MQNIDLFPSQRTIAKELLTFYTYPYEVILNINRFIMEKGPQLGPQYQEIEKDIWVHESAYIADSAYLLPPCIIDEGASILHNAFIKGNVIVGKNCVIGNASEIKNSLLCDSAVVPHFNYVGDSILGYKAHMGAGSITSNLKSDRSSVTIHTNPPIHTNLQKVGAFLGDNVEVGCNAVLAPGSCIGPNTTIYPLIFVRGIIPANSLMKSPDKIVSKQLPSI